MFLVYAFKISLQFLTAVKEPILKHVMVSITIEADALLDHISCLVFLMLGYHFPGHLCFQAC